jgi:hypothetical protein
MRNSFVGKSDEVGVYGADEGDDGPEEPDDEGDTI